MTTQAMKIEFDLGNAAFADGNREHEIARILDRIARRAQEGENEGAIHDINGNKVGNWYFDPEGAE